MVCVKGLRGFMSRLSASKDGEAALEDNPRGTFKRSLRSPDTLSRGPWVHSAAVQMHFNGLYMKGLDAFPPSK